MRIAGTAGYLGSFLAVTSGRSAKSTLVAANVEISPQCDFATRNTPPKAVRARGMLPFVGRRCKRTSSMVIDEIHLEAITSNRKISRQFPVMVTLLKNLQLHPSEDVDATRGTMRCRRVAPPAVRMSAIFSAWPAGSPAASSASKKRRSFLLLKHRILLKRNPTNDGLHGADVVADTAQFAMLRPGRVPVDCMLALSDVSVTSRCNLTRLRALSRRKAPHIVVLIVLRLRFTRTDP